MACQCLSRHLEDRILTLSLQYDETPRWRAFRRRRLWERQCVLFEILRAAYANEGAA